jgi:ABC-type polysaccharide/polyol phosphate export permease
VTAPARYVVEAGGDRWHDWRRTANLLGFLTRRHLAQRYRGSTLGFLWTLMNPALLMVVYTLVFRGILRLPATRVPFPAFLLTGLFVWNFFSTATLNAMASTQESGPLLSRVYFPRFVLPLSAVLSNLVNYLAAVPILLAFNAVLGVPPGPSLLLFPAALVLAALLASGAGLLLAGMAPFFRDLAQILEVLLLALFFASPVVYPVELAQANLGRVGAVLFRLNPLAGLLTLVRGVFLGEPIDWILVATAFVVAAGVLAAGAAVFRRLSPRLAEAA